MMNLEPVALSDSWEECPGFFVLVVGQVVLITVTLR